jgi:mersacidin/lichenicidin family type 2 lantibiotic
MTSDQIIRAWKDADYGATLSLAESAAVPAHPSGDIDLSDVDLGLTAGGMVNGTQYLETLGCCEGFTSAGRCDITAGFNGGCTAFCFTIFWSGFC